MPRRAPIVSPRVIEQRSYLGDSGINSSVPLWPANLVFRVKVDEKYPDKILSHEKPVLNRVEPALHEEDSLSLGL